VRMGYSKAPLVKPLSYHIYIWRKYHLTFIMLSTFLTLKIFAVCSDIFLQFLQFR
jgi:hypothetical protein